MHTRKIAIAAGILAMLAATNAYANTMSAQDFVTKASIANQFEIDSSKLALEKAQNSEVKSFAQRMVDDHTKTGDRMKEVLDSSDSNAKPADELDNKHQKLLDKLQDTSGNAFDRQYIAIQTDAHKEAVSLFADYSKNGKDKALKNFAGKTLPTLKDHLKHVQQLKANK
jgi:putative membrane protein